MITQNYSSNIHPNYQSQLIINPRIKLHDCPNCSCSSPKTSPTKQFYQINSINHHSPHKPKDYSIMNINLLPPKVFVQHTNKFHQIHSDYLNHQPNSIYLNRISSRNTSRGNSSHLNNQHIYQRKSISPDHFIQPYPINTFNHINNFTNLPINSRPVSPIIKPLSSVTSLTNLHKPKISISYVNKYQPYNKQISTQSKISIYTAQPKPPNILQKSKEKKKKQLTSPLNNNNWKMGSQLTTHINTNQINNQQSITKFKTMLINNNYMKTTKFTSNKSIEQIHQQSHHKQNITNHFNNISQKIQNINKNKNINSQQQLIYSKIKQIQLNCDHFLSPNISDGSISDDTQLL